MLKPITCPQLLELSPGGIRLWLQDLANAEVLWHFDDHPDSINWLIYQGDTLLGSFTGPEVFGPSYIVLAWLYNEVITYCDQHSIDIFSLYPKI